VEIIEKKLTLPVTARRAGWTGCNIVLKGIPIAGRIPLVRDGAIIPKTTVLEAWRKTLFLRDKDPTARGWLLNVMKCVEKLRENTFSIDQVYTFESDLKRMYPRNRHIREKIRQQLQILRDMGYLEFVGRGVYRVSMDDRQT
jgi:type II restriction enzyme